MAEQIIGKLREADVELARGMTVPEVVWKRVVVQADRPGKVRGLQPVEERLLNDALAVWTPAEFLAPAPDAQAR